MHKHLLQAPLKRTRPASVVPVHGTSRWAYAPCLSPGCLPFSHPPIPVPVFWPCFIEANVYFGMRWSSLLWLKSWESAWKGAHLPSCPCPAFSVFAYVQTDGWTKVNSELLCWKVFKMFPEFLEAFVKSQNGINTVKH